MAKCADVPHSVLCDRVEGEYLNIEISLILDITDIDIPAKHNSQDGIIELHGGKVPREGNVFIDGRPVCDDSWDLSDAIVTCRMLGY